MLTKDAFVGAGGHKPPAPFSTVKASFEPYPDFCTGVLHSFPLVSPPYGNRVPRVSLGIDWPDGNLSCAAHTAGGSSPGVCMSNAPNAGIFVPFEKTHPLLDVDHLKDVVSSKLKDSKELGDLISRQIRDYVDELGLSSDQKASVTDWLQERDGVVRHNILQQLMDQD